MEDAKWPALVASAPVVPFEGRLVRCIPQITFDSGDPPSYLFTSGGVNRCNPEGVRCIYMGGDEETAVCEYNSYYVEPEPKLTYYADFKGMAVIDFGDDATRNHFGLTDADFFEGFRLKTSKTPLQSIGEIVSRQHQISAIHFPSSACHRKSRTGFNIAIFPQAIEAPGFLRILGRAGTILEEWP